MKIAGKASGFRIIPHDSEHYWQEVLLRDLLLRKPLGLKFSKEELQAEDKEIHIVYLENDIVQACLVLKPVDEQKIKMRQVAVAKNLQKKGIGKQLVAFSEDYAIKRGYKIMECHARDVAIAFYKKLDYQIVGDQFVEVTIPHFKMVKKLA